LLEKLLLPVGCLQETVEGVGLEQVVGHFQLVAFEGIYVVGGGEDDLTGQGRVFQQLDARWREGGYRLLQQPIGGLQLKGLETGADDYLVKPFDARELQVRVANLIAGRQKLQAYFRKKLNPFLPKEVEAESLDAVFLNKVRLAVEANLEDENFSVVELGAQVGMSRSQLHRKLSALTGYSPNEVIRNMRLERAKQLLEKKAGNASEVAYMTGFSSPAYFAKCFKDYFGVTPSEVG